MFKSKPFIIFIFLFIFTITSFAKDVSKVFSVILERDGFIIRAFTFFPTKENEFIQFKNKTYIFERQNDSLFLKIIYNQNIICETVFNIPNPQRFQNSYFSCNNEQYKLSFYSMK